MSFPLPSATLCDVGLAADPLDRLFHIIDEHVATGRYPGAQIAIARNGQLAVVKTFGDRTIDPARAPAHDDTLWLLYSNTKVLTACAVWLLVERGALRFTDAVAAHVPEFKKHCKGEITVEFRRAGSPAGGGYATARAMAAFYQMMASGGTLNGVRLLSPRLVEYVTRNYTGERVDGYMGMPMHRGLGPHVRGTTDTIRGLGSLAHPRTFGHGGVGSSYCWADPESGVSFAYLTNSRVPDPWHTARLDLVSNCVHSAIDAV